MKPEEKKQESKQEDKYEDSLIRILSTDLSGKGNVYSQLTRIKGVSWNFSNAICRKMGIDRKKKIRELSKEEIQKITLFVKNPSLPEFMMNRRKDLDSGTDKHLIGSDLDLRKEFDIKRLRKIKSYKGARHATGQPVRGQRTKSHFRKNKTVGVSSKKKK